MSEEQKKLFIKEYIELCKKYSLIISSSDDWYFVDQSSDEEIEYHEKSIKESIKRLSSK